MSQADIMHAAGFFTAQETADVIGASYLGNVHRMVKKGTLHGERVGTHWYVQVSSLLEWAHESPTMLDRIRAKIVELKIPGATIYGGGNVRSKKAKKSGKKR